MENEFLDELLNEFKADEGQKDGDEAIKDEARAEGQKTQEQKPEGKKDKLSEDGKVEAVLEKLGLKDKIAKIDELEKNANEAKAEKELSQKYALVEAELKKLNPDIDLKALGELGAKLEGLKDGDLQSWKVLMRLLGGKKQNTPDTHKGGSNGTSGGREDFEKKLKDGSVDNVSLGAELLRLSGM